MKTAGISEARRHLSRLLERVRKGESVVITRRGRPVAVLSPLEPSSNRTFISRKKLRERIHLRGRPVSEAVGEEREDRG